MNEKKERKKTKPKQKRATETAIDNDSGYENSKTNININPVK